MTNHFPAVRFLSPTSYAANNMTPSTGPPAATSFSQPHVPPSGLALLRRLPDTLSAPVQLAARRRLMREWVPAHAYLRGTTLVVTARLHPSFTLAIDVRQVHFVTSPTGRRPTVIVRSAPISLSSSSSSSSSASAAAASSSLYGATGSYKTNSRHHQRHQHRFRPVHTHTISARLRLTHRSADWVRALTAVAMVPIPRLAHFSVLCPIGKGGGGEVYVVRDSRDSRAPPLAMKVVQKHAAFASPATLRRALDERLALELVRGFPFIVRLTHAFQTATALYMATTYCPGGDLRGLLRRTRAGRLSEATAKPLLAQIVLALEHVHSLQILFRDLKPENVLLSAQGDVRLCDFGLCKILPPTTRRPVRARSFCGSTMYMSPQIVSAKPYGFATDLWSLGALFFRVLVGRAPFEQPPGIIGARNDAPDVHARIIADTPVIPTFISPEARQLLLGLLRKHEEERFTLQQVKRSTYFADIDWNDILEQGYKRASPSKGSDSGSASSPSHSPSTSTTGAGGGSGAGIGTLSVAGSTTTTATMTCGTGATVKQQPNHHHQTHQHQQVMDNNNDSLVTDIHPLSTQGADDDTTTTMDAFAVPVLGPRHASDDCDSNTIRKKNKKKKKYSMTTTTNGNNALTPAQEQHGVPQKATAGGGPVHELVEGLSNFDSERLISHGVKLEDDEMLMAPPCRRSGRIGRRSSRSLEQPDRQPRVVKSASVVASSFTSLFVRDAGRDAAIAGRMVVGFNFCMAEGRPLYGGAGHSPAGDSDGAMHNRDKNDDDDDNESNSDGHHHHHHHHHHPDVDDEDYIES